MGNPKFTPGPWVAHTDVEDPIITSLGAPYEPQIAVISSGDPIAETQANAALIAAAPDLYETLKMAEATLDVVGVHFNLLETLKTIRSVLAKARGEK